MEDKIIETFSSHPETQDQKKEGKVLVMTSVLNLGPSVFITVRGNKRYWQRDENLASGNLIR